MISSKIHKIIAGRYEVLKPLGAGSFGEVYKCRDIETGLSVAAKFVKFALP